MNKVDILTIFTDLSSKALMKSTERLIRRKVDADNTDIFFEIGFTIRQLQDHFE